MKRSKFSLSNYRLTSLSMGQLYPVACEEVLPGDSFRHQVSALVRAAPLNAPVMHPVHLSVHSWFVPNRLVWDSWEKFITGSDTNLVVPTVAFNMTSVSSSIKKLVQAMGVGAETATVTLNALPFRAYNLIYNEFYRDPDLTTPLTVNTGAGPDTDTNYQLRAPSWEKDYFTTARPFPQQGSSTEVAALTVSGSLPVQGIGILATDRAFNQSNQNVVETSGAATYQFSGQAATAGKFFIKGDAATTGTPQIFAAGGNLSVNMDINEWRRSMAMQRLREHRNRFGSRYRDMLAFLGVNSSDARLQRPEYLGGGKQTISFSEVLSTADTATAKIGVMAGHGIAAMRTRPYKRFFEEHGYVLTFLFARPVSVYMNRVPRHFLRRDYEQYWQKELEAMGEQAITNAEVYGDAGTPAGTFGYIPRYDEYRHGESSVSGEFRTTLDMWHQARKFASQPALNAAFVGCDPAARIFQSTTTDQLYAMVAHRLSARRLVAFQARN